MQDIADQQELAEEISTAISKPVGFGEEFDEVSDFMPTTPASQLMPRLPLHHETRRISWGDPASIHEVCVCVCVCVCTGTCRYACIIHVNVSNGFHKFLS